MQQVKVRQCLIQGGGVKADGEKITDMAYTFNFDDSVYYKQVNVSLQNWFNPYSYFG